MTFRLILLRKRNVSEEFVEKVITHILYSITLFRKSCRLWNEVKKYCRAGQATDDNMSHAHSMLDNKDYKNTFRIGNTYCFFSATMFARTSLSVTFTYIICLVTNLGSVSFHT